MIPEISLNEVFDRDKRAGPARNRVEKAPGFR